MKRFIWSFVFVAVICIMCSDLPSTLNAQDLTPGESKAIVQEAQDEYSFERDIAKNPLKPPETSSPQATMQGFIDNMNRSYNILMTAHRQNIEAPGLFASEAVQQMARDAELLLERSVYYLNLSEIPEGLRDPVGHEGALMLKDIFDRIELPPFSQIPDARAVRQAREQGHIADFTRWRVPNTTIEIAMVEDGHRKGEYLFTPRTVARLSTFYEKVQNLPYKSAVSTSSNFFNFYVSTPGRLLPPKWSQWLPAWSTALYFGQTVWQWCAIAVGPLLTLLFLIGLYRRFRSRAPSISTARRLWRWTLLALMTSGVILALYYILHEHVNITGSVRMI